MSDFATKPVEPGVLYAMLAHWIRPRNGGTDPQPLQPAEAWRLRSAVTPNDA